MVKKGNPPGKIPYSVLWLAGRVTGQRADRSLQPEMTVMGCRSQGSSEQLIHPCWQNWDERRAWLSMQEPLWCNWLPGGQNQQEAHPLTGSHKKSLTGQSKDDLFSEKVSSWWHNTADMDSFLWNISVSHWRHQRLFFWRISACFNLTFLTPQEFSLAR